MEIYILVDTNGTPFAFKKLNKAISYMKKCYDDDVEYVDTINGMRHYIWKGNNEYITIRKSEIFE